MEDNGRCLVVSEHHRDQLSSVWKSSATGYPDGDQADTLRLNIVAELDVIYTARSNGIDHKEGEGLTSNADCRVREWKATSAHVARGAREQTNQVARERLVTTAPGLSGCITVTVPAAAKQLNALKTNGQAPKTQQQPDRLVSSLGGFVGVTSPAVRPSPRIAIKGRVSTLSVNEIILSHVKTLSSIPSTHLITV